MSERERHDESGMPPSDGGAAPGVSGNLEELRRAGEDLLAAGDEAIRRALSGNSEAFLRANRQEGGE
ncbi:MAG TPA: hypothetical protein VGQ69_10295 [Gemmatimonadales bacterium]|jgi:hypothetical protein|nr:hypothetical protein [Gemmatimonadales bacterium]